MLSFFLKIMNQNCGSYVCVQLLQTLNILFENIRNETSICKFWLQCFFLCFFDCRCLISLLLWFTHTIFDFFFFPDYLLSNNHVNSIIVHKFDFSDEEVMAYYISFLKTLSFRLNKHTIHFFYNEVSFCRNSNFVFLIFI